MKLQELDFHPGRDTACIADIMSIIERNVDKLDINTSPITDWAHQLQYFKKLKKLNLHRINPRDLEAETTFWTAVSQLPNLKIIQADTLPIPPRLDLSFPHVINLQLIFVVDMDRGEWSQSVITIFKQMPGLEHLKILAAIYSMIHDEARAMQITTIACTNLKDLTLSCPIPSGLLSTIARHCPHLTKCYIEDDAIDDEDLRQLSLSCPNLQQIRLRNAKTIKRLDYFATFQHLEVLELYYLAGKFIDKPLLLQLLDSCPKLKQITVSDWNISSIRRPGGREFEETAPKNLFAAATELPSYFEPKISKGQLWTPDGLIDYAVRIDRLREDISQFQQLTKRLGMRLVRDFFLANVDFL
jgi:hypothetical protein